MFSWRRLAFLCVTVLPLAAWFLVKPVRVVAPGLVGVTCQTATVCVDDPARFGEATALYREAEEFVSRNVEQIGISPKLVFCSTEACAQAFGLGARAAVTQGTLGTVLGPRAWVPHLVRHEMIHYVQARRMNVYRMLFTPKWWIEGMAYELSEDPGTPLAEPWESDRRQFRRWYEGVGKARLWEEARKL